MLSCENLVELQELVVNSAEASDNNEVSNGGGIRTKMSSEIKKRTKPAIKAN